MKPTTIVLALATVVHASSGDRDAAFLSCLSQRIAKTCQEPGSDSDALVPGPFPLRLTGWTCEDDCKYHCAHLMTDSAIREGRRPEQFYGKWAFWRVLGMQEPASVAFSLLNLWAHVRGGKAVRRRVRGNHPMRSYYLWFTVVGLNVWVWSAVFHTRDRPWTERLDYFSAGLAIVYGLFYSVVRLYHLYLHPRVVVVVLHNEDPPRHRLLAPWAALCSVFYLAHIAYLLLSPRFDYSWNMKANMTVGLAHTLLWMSYALPPALVPFRRFRSTPNGAYRPPYAARPAYIGAATVLASCLEIADFPPWWRVVDAHSLWHLATVPIVVAWYQFLIEDAVDPAWKEGML